VARILLESKEAAAGGAAAILFGVSLGPAMGGVLAASCGVAAPFVAVAGCGVATAIYSYHHLPETHPAPQHAATSCSNVACRSDAGIVAGKGKNTSNSGGGDGGGGSASTHDGRSNSLQDGGGGAWCTAAWLLRDPRFCAVGAANAASFALRQGGRNVLLVLYATSGRCPLLLPPFLPSLGSSGQR
jgi:hypothetical protein